MHQGLSTISAMDGWMTGGKRGARDWFFLLSLLLVTLGASARQPLEHEVKAAFLLNFAKFIEWPPKVFPDAAAPLILGVVGQDPFGEALRQIVQGQTAQGRRIEIRYLRPDEDPAGCHALFLSRSLAAETEAILSRLRDKPVLTVGESEDFLQQGGMIGFALVDKTVRFDISVGALKKTGLNASSKLLAVARSVRKSP